MLRRLVHRLRAGAHRSEPPVGGDPSWRAAQAHRLAALPLEVTARRARAPWAGTIVTRARGPGDIFRELRAYAPGDPVRRIDWRASARLDRWLVRETERHSHLRILLVVDRSGSMAYGRGGPSKDDHATVVAAALARHAVRAGHAVGYVDGRGTVAPPATRLDAWQATLAEPASGTFTLDEPARRLLPEVDLVLALGDWLDPGAEVLVGALAAAPWTEVRCLQLLHPDELTFSLRGPIRLEPLEGEAAPRELDPAVVRAAYLEALHAHLERLRTVASQRGIAWHGTTTTDDPALALRFLATGVP